MDRVVSSIRNAWKQRVISAYNAASGLVRVNLICQLFRLQVSRYLVRHYSGVSVSVVLDEISIFVHRLTKADCSPQNGWVFSNQFKAGIEPKGSPSCELKVTPSTQLPLSWFIMFFSPAFGLELKCWLFLGLEPSNLQTSYSLCGSHSYGQFFLFNYPLPMTLTSAQKEHCFLQGLRTPALW